MDCKKFSDSARHDEGPAAAIFAGARIVGSVILQDMQTRFGRNYFSFLVAVGWPLAHAMFMIGGYLLINKLAPIGDDPAIFIATGALTYVLCFYPGRSISLLYLQQRQLLGMPVIKPIHLIYAGLVIELLTAAIVAIVICSALALTGTDIIPINPTEAASALGATLLLAVGLGVFNVVLVALIGPFYVVVYVMIMVGLYLTAGVFIPIWMVPEPARSVMKFNPLLNLVEWIRSAYYASYDPDLVNKPLVLGTALVALFLGLLGERFLRNKFYV